MKQNLFKLLVLCGIIAALLLNAGCTPPPPPTEPPTEPPTAAPTAPPPTEDLQKSLSERYLAAVAAIDESAYRLKVNYNRTVTVAGVSYTESSSMQLDRWQEEGQDALIKMKEDVNFGDLAHKVSVTEIYSQGQIYQTINDSHNFRAEYPAEYLDQRYLTLKLLNPENYTLSADADRRNITFQEGVNPESWAAGEDVQLISASGSAVLNDQDALEKTTYQLEYRSGPAQILVNYEVTVEEVGRKPELPGEDAGFVALEDISAAYALEHAYGYLIQATHLQASYSMQSMIEAAALFVSDHTVFNVYDQNDTYAMLGEYNIQIMSSDGNDAMEMEERFENGKYTSITNGGRPETNSSVTKEIVKGAITDTLIHAFPSLDYIESVTVTDMGSLLLFEFTGTLEMNEDMKATIGEEYLGDGNLLDSVSTKYEPETTEFYLSLDRYSLLPVSYGISFRGVHTIQRQKAAIWREHHYSYDLASLNSYVEIFDEHAPEDPPENPATPLFYKVTGADGQQMWLLGTIHVGDERTAYLPQEIYDALKGSDALAVESNVEAFYDKLDEDENLAAQMSDAFYYADGTTFEDHIVTESVYEGAVQMLKAIGSYNGNMPYAKPSLWESAISAYQLQQGYGLMSEKGVDARLIRLAEADDMPIWDIEDPLKQSQMSARFSDELQEVQLFMALASSFESYQEGVQELYEAWCAGDEEQLTQLLNDNEPWILEESDFNLEGLSEEEKAEAQAIIERLPAINEELVKLEAEYDDAISTTRNKLMLERAREYLESRVTVFYAVGLSHLLQEDGLVNTLRAAGYTVELVSYGS